MYMLCLYNVFEDFYVFSINIPCISTTFDENTWQTQRDHSVNPCYIISHGRMCLRVSGQTLPEYVVCFNNSGTRRDIKKR